jgi:subtilisin family serine protease
MARQRTLFIAGAFAFLLMLFAVPLAPASDGDEDDDDDNGGVRLEHRPIMGRGPAEIRYVPGQLLVRFRVGTTETEAEAAAARAGGTVVDHLAALGLHVLEVSRSQTDEAMESLRFEPAVESVEQDVFVRGLDTVPNDPLWPAQWGLRLVGAPRAWDATRGTSAIVIAVLDTGIDGTHADLAGSTVAGRDVLNNDSDPADDEGHGTAVAGVIASRTDNSEGHAGMCWVCSLLPVKVLDSGGNGSTSTVASGIVWAVDHGAHVINMSLGGPGSTSALASAVAYATSRNVVVVAAAGNSGVDTPFYPAGYSDVISVAATNDADARYSWSNFGNWVRVAAPGCNAAPRRGGGYVEFCGTSSAASVVSGLAALMLSLRPTASRAEIEQSVATNTTPVPGVAFGRVEAPAALTAVSPTALPAPPSAPAPPPPPPVPGSPQPAAAPPPPAVHAPANLKRPRLHGRSVVGRRLRIAPGVWSPEALRLSYQWRRCSSTGGGCRTIRGARGQTHRLTRRDRGRRLRGVVVAANAGGTARALTRTSALVRRARR